MLLAKQDLDLSLIQRRKQLRLARLGRQGRMPSMERRAVPAPTRSIEAAETEDQSAADSMDVRLQAGVG